MANPVCPGLHEQQSNSVDLREIEVYTQPKEWGFPFLLHLPWHLSKDKAVLIGHRISANGNFALYLKIYSFIFVFTAPCSPLLASHPPPPSCSPLPSLSLLQLSYYFCSDLLRFSRSCTCCFKYGFQNAINTLKKQQQQMISRSSALPATSLKYTASRIIISHPRGPSRQLDNCRKVLGKYPWGPSDLP